MITHHRERSYLINVHIWSLQEHVRSYVIIHDHMIISDHIWSYMIICNHIWSYYVRAWSHHRQLYTIAHDHVIKYHYICPYMMIVEHIWPYIIFDYIWPRHAPDGQTPGRPADSPWWQAGRLPTLPQPARHPPPHPTPPGHICIHNICTCTHGSFDFVALPNREWDPEYRAWSSSPGSAALRMELLHCSLYHIK